MSDVAVIVVAAGRGERFGAPKQFLDLAGSRVVDRAVATARLAGEVILVLPPGMAWEGVAVGAVVAGGATRAESVRAGMRALAPTHEVVVVHDAARPLASLALYEAVIGAVRDGADGAVPGLPIADTLKRVEGTRVRDTVDRSTMIAVQTPQAFRRAALEGAHRGGGDATDDAALVEDAGGTVVVVPGETANLKVTGPSDLAVAGALLADRARSER